MDLPKWLKVGISVVIYCVSVSAVPIYNKLVFSGAAGDPRNSAAAEEIGKAGLRKYPYPIATAFLQLGVVAVCLGAANVCGHVCRIGGRRSSWILGPHLRYKLQHVAPVGLLFGLKYGVTNWGLQLVPVGMHLLLQSSDLLWTVVTARLVNKEHPSCLELLAAALSTAGSLMIAMHAVDTLVAPMIPLLVNLLTPLMLALCVSTLRAGTKELFRADNRLEGSVTPTEFTALKLALSSFTALLLAMLMESGYVQLARGDEGAAPVISRPPWWVALAEEPPEGIMAVLFGGVLVLIFQVNLTWLAGLTSALAVGIVGGLKVVPQWLLNALFNLQVNLAPLNIVGAACVLFASTLYAAASYGLVVGPKGFDYRSPQPPWRAPSKDSDCGRPLLDPDPPLQPPLGDCQGAKSAPVIRCFERPDFILESPLLIARDLCHGNKEEESLDDSRNAARKHSF